MTNTHRYVLIITAFLLALVSIGLLSSIGGPSAQPIAPAPEQEDTFRIGFYESSDIYIINDQPSPNLEEISAYKQQKREDVRRYEAAKSVGESERFYHQVEEDLEEYYEDFYEDLFDDLRINFNDDNYDRYVDNFDIFFRANYDEDEIARDEKIEIFQFYLQQYDTAELQQVRNERV
jgi:hypothetical protein